MSSKDWRLHLLLGPGKAMKRNLRIAASLFTANFKSKDGKSVFLIHNAGHSCQVADFRTGVVKAFEMSNYGVMHIEAYSFNQKTRKRLLFAGNVAIRLIIMLRPLN
jgi:peptidase E